MKQRMPTRRRTLSTLSVIGLIICFAIAGGCGYIYYQFSQELKAIDELRLLNRSPEAVFQFRFMDGHPIPSEVSEIHGVEGASRIGESIGPAYIRFNTTGSFIREMVTKDYGRNGKYTLTSCPSVPFSDFFIEQFPEEFEWWRPSEVTRPVCYRAHTCRLYDEKFLLIDTDNNIVYFYRTPICGLCPSGQIGAELRESKQCQQ
jgi:hypothetical protein